MAREVPKQEKVLKQRVCKLEAEIAKWKKVFDEVAEVLGGFYEAGYTLADAARNAVGSYDGASVDVTRLEGENAMLREQFAKECSAKHVARRRVEQLQAEASQQRRDERSARASGVRIAVQVIRSCAAHDVVRVLEERAAELEAPAR